MASFDLIKTFKQPDLEFVRTLAALLNSSGGVIYFEANDPDSLVKEIKKLIRVSLRPSANLPIVYRVRFADGKTYLTLEVSPIIEKVVETTNRFGSELLVIKGGTIRALDKDDRASIMAIKQGLYDPMYETAGLNDAPTYRYFRLMLGGAFLDMEELSLENYFRLRNQYGSYNLNSDLLSDQNPFPLYLYKFTGKSVSANMSRTDYGHRPLYLAIEALRMRIEAESMAAVDLGIPAIDQNLINEALSNAIAHNNWLRGAPSVLLFDNRIEFRSYITPGEGVDLDGYPKNPSLFKALQAIGFANGLRRGHSVLQNYSGYRYKISDKDTYCVTLYYEVPISFIKERRVKRLALSLKESEARVLSMLQNDPTLRAEDICYLISRSKKSVERAFVSLQQQGYIRRIGSKRYGHWEIVRD